MRPKALVRAGYDAIAQKYLESRVRDAEDMGLLGDLTHRLPSGAKVLDAGCGAGVPITQLLSRSFRVFGVDLSLEQLHLARRLVPDAEFQCADMTRLPFRPGVFDAICSYYAIIHVPREEHSGLLRDFHRVLRPDGLILVCLGANDLRSDIEDDYYGAPMYWSHFDAETSVRLVREAGFRTLRTELVPDMTSPGSHLFVLARRGLIGPAEEPSRG